MAGYFKITKQEFYNGGGFSNVNLLRVEKGGRWTYWKKGD